VQIKSRRHENLSRVAYLKGRLDGISCLQAYNHFHVEEWYCMVAPPVKTKKRRK
jgi:hypothetical protein